MSSSYMNKFASALLPLIVLACGSDPNGPGLGGGGAQPPVGSYSAIIFVTTGTSGVTNQLQNGSSLSINLAANSTTSGHLHVAPSGSTPAFDANMAGTWQVSGDQVSFKQTDDSFMNDLIFTIQPLSASAWSLVADGVVQGTRINLTLAQNP